MQASQPHHPTHIRKTEYHTIISMRAHARENNPTEGLFHVEHYTPARTTHTKEKQRNTHVPRGTSGKTNRTHQATTHPAQETRIFATEEIN